MNKARLDEFVLKNMPHFIAVSYQRLLAAWTPQEQVERALYAYTLGLRTLTISMVSQYLTLDRERVSDPYLNELLLNKFTRRLTLDAWQKLLFASLRTYEGKRNLMFMPEFYEFYWDASRLPHQRRVEVEQSFNRLTQIALESRKQGMRPKSETGWQKLAEETTGLLQHVLDDMAFIEKYDLIRVLDRDESFYDFELHKGLEVSEGRQRVPEHMTLDPGWFYFRNGLERFLVLHPFLVFWESESADAELIPSDVGVYDSFIYEQLRYLLTSLGREVVDEIRVKRFVAILFETIEEIKRQRQEVEKLTWWQLRDISADISRLRMATVTEKYRSELYLQRAAAHHEFENFLESDKRCFVLTGKSGVGKSNFLLASAEELRTRSDVCVLTYDGAVLRVEPSVVENVSGDFSDRLLIGGRRIQHIWREIARIDGIEHKQVIFIVDAVNESQQPRELLRELDELVQGPWPWLKVVFSSRPETWQTIKRGVKLAEALYYRMDESDTLGVELEPFSYQELPEVYANYQQAFGLQTSYEALRGEIRHTLQDPLNLWLVAKTYENKSIPDDLKVTELAGRYVEELLEREDLRLLEDLLVPLMVGDEHYSNVITPGDIDAVGDELYEAVYSEQVLSDGRRMNESFTNLLDAEILVRQGQGRDEKIVFKYERFYEYFVGGSLFNKLGSRERWDEGSLIDQYHEWMSHLSVAPYLWGAVKNCLTRQMGEQSAENNAKLCMDLAQTQNRRMEEVLIAALSEYGSDDREKVSKSVEYVLERGRGWFGTLIQRDAIASNCPIEKRVAISVASNLRMGSLLEYVLTDSSPAVRAVAMRHAFIYWRRDRVGAFEILDGLSQGVTGSFGLPNLRAVESILGFSVMILIDDFENEDTMARLRSMGRRIIEHLLRINPEDLDSKREWLKGAIRRVLLRGATGFLVRTAREAPTNSVLSVPELRSFFKQDGDQERRRGVVRRLVELMRSAMIDAAEIRREILVLAYERDILIGVLAAVVLRRFVMQNPEAALRLLQDLFDRAIQVEPPGPFSAFVPARAIFMDMDYAINVARDTYLDMVTTYLEEGKGRWRSNLQTRRWCYLDYISFLESKNATDTPITPTARQYLRKMIEDDNYTSIKAFIEWELTVRAVETGQLRFAFSALEMLVDIEEPSVREAVVELLARVRVYYPDKVDDFLEINDLDEQFVRAVRTRAPAETVSDLLNYRALVFFQETFFQTESPELWHKVTWVFDELSKCESLEEWLSGLVKVAINLIYGGPVFKDAPA